jgi:hypothetical protein
MQMLKVIDKLVTNFGTYLIVHISVHILLIIIYHCCCHIFSIATDLLDVVLR